MPNSNYASFCLHFLFYRSNMFPMVLDSKDSKRSNPRKLLDGYDHVSRASLTNKTKIRGLIPEKAYDVNCGYLHSVLVRMSLACVFVHLAGAQDLEHEWEAVCYEFLCVLLLFNRAELFQQTLDQRPPVLQETGSQGLHPGVQRPGHP